MTLLPDSLIPANEPERIRRLHQYEILNTTPERIFDEFVALSAQLFNLPISLISLVGEEQVFFKANTGLPGLERVDRPDSLCSAAILQNQVLAYNDLSVERCSLVNPFVAQSAGLRFYAGAALRMPEGENIGSLCVIGREARQIEPEEQTLLLEMADLVSLTIELRLGYLRLGQTEQWQHAQHKLEEILHDNAAFARYLTARTGTITARPDHLEQVMARLQDLRRQLLEYQQELAAEL